MKYWVQHGNRSPCVLRVCRTAFLNISKTVTILVSQRERKLSEDVCKYLMIRYVTTLVRVMFGDKL